jgi:ABC-type Fe3+/spermidine/putrescine transport system ATPase subunit
LASFRGKVKGRILAVNRSKEASRSIHTPLLQLEAISKTYPGGTQALVDIDLTVRAGEILCLLGPSGCGKTTLLRVVAGLEQPDRGHLLLNGRDLAHVPPHRRGFGFMFQDFALFPHRTVAENIAFGLRMAGMSRADQAEQVAAMLELVNLPGYGSRTIFELSGGERQRVALARSLAPNPTLLMLDEPLGSLDRTLREELVEELRTILKEMGVTSLYVTHDQEEAMALGDRMVIMQRGHIEQKGTPTEVYTHPATPFAARFLGFTNLLPATPVPDGVMTPLGPFPLNPADAAPKLTLLLRPEAARLAPPSTQKKAGFHRVDGGNQNANDVVLLQGDLLGVTYHGSSYRVEVEVDANTQKCLLVFQLPAYQHNGQDESLQPLQLPPIGAPLQLLIYTNMAALLPYPAITA